MKVKKIKLVPPPIIKIELTETEARWLYALTGQCCGISPVRENLTSPLWNELEKILGEWEGEGGKQAKFNKELPDGIDLTPH